MGFLEFLVGIKCDTCGKRRSKRELSRGCSRCGRTVCKACMGPDGRLCHSCKKELGRD